MCKDIFVASYKSPEILGFNDKISVLENNINLFHCDMSACPNPYKIVEDQPNIPWNQVYGWVATNTPETPYRWECIISPTHGDKRILMNHGGRVPTRNIDFTNNAFYANAVEIHPAQADGWRGSKACFTIPFLIWPNFIKLFAIGESGNLYVQDYSQLAKGV